MENDRNQIVRRTAVFAGRRSLREALWRQKPAPGDRRSAVAAASKASSNRTKMRKGGLRGRRRLGACPTSRLSAYGYRSWRECLRH